LITTSSNTIITQNYDTTINVIGGLADCNVIYKSIESFFNKNDSVHHLILDRNEFHLRTEKSRMRIECAVKSAFLSFNDDNHKELIENIFQNNISLHERELVLFWQFALNNRLFRDISSKVFMKIYFSGRTGISKEDIIAYLKEFIQQNHSLNITWSENTIHMLATKYLSFMTKLNFVEGARKKTFKYIRISDELLTIFIYFAKLFNSRTKNILENEMLLLSFVETIDIKERLKKLSLKGFFYIDYNGVSLNIELTHSYKGIVDVLYHRS